MNKFTTKELIPPPVEYERVISWGVSVSKIGQRIQ
jgi:hypothetical protein